MQRGAYEAMALEKPLITSNWEILRNTFYYGTIHVNANAAEIIAAVSQAKREQSQLTRDMQKLRQERLGVFTTNLRALQQAIA